MMSRTTIERLPKQLYLRSIQDLKKRGFKFTGPVQLCHFYRLPVLVDDHENDCEWKRKVK